MPPNNPLHYAKSLVIPAAAQQGRLEHRRPGTCYAGTTVESPVFARLGKPPRAVVLEMRGPVAELNNGLRLAAKLLTPVETGEVWKPVEGFDGRYLVSSHGQVVSTQYQRSQRERLLLHAREGVFPMVCLQLGKVRGNVGVARLVAAHFLPPPPTPAHNVVVHLDRDANNLRAENLRWIIQGEGEGGLGLTSGEAHHNARLTDAEVVAIRAAYATGRVTQQALATEYEVTRATITGIVAGYARRRTPHATPHATQNPRPAEPNGG